MTNLDKMLDGTTPTMVEFYATWCRHCTRMMPVAAQLQDEERGRMNLVQIDGDENPELLDRYEIWSYPSWLLFKDGKLLWRDGGEKTFDQLMDAVRQAI